MIHVGKRLIKLLKVTYSVVTNNGAKVWCFQTVNNLNKFGTIECINLSE